MNKIELKDGQGNAAVVAPRLGAWLLRYARQTRRYGPVEVLRYSTECLNQYPAMHAGSFLMFPVAGHTTSQGRPDHFCWNGVERQMPLHGFARRLPWAIADLSNISVSLTLEANDATREVYPFEFRLRLTYELRDGALVSRLAVENLGDEPIPFSTGFHPYIRTPLTAAGRRDRCVARIPASREFTVTAAGVTAAAYHDGRSLTVTTPAIPARHFCGFDDFKASLTDEIGAVSVTLDADFTSRFRCLSVWSPTADASFYCIEPRTALQDAFSNAGTDQLTILAPGAAFLGQMRLDLLD